MKKQNKLNHEIIIDWLYMMTGIANPTEQTNEIAWEAIVYSDISYYTRNPKTKNERIDKNKFEARVLSYFTRKMKQYDIK